MSDWGVCDSHPGFHTFRNDPDPCIGWQQQDMGVALADVENDKTTLYNALMVMLKDPKASRWIKKNDPMAYEQAVAAVNEVKPDSITPTFVGVSRHTIPVFVYTDVEGRIYKVVADDANLSDPVAYVLPEDCPDGDCINGWDGTKERPITPEVAAQVKAAWESAGDWPAWEWGW